MPKNIASSARNMMIAAAEKYMNFACCCLIQLCNASNTEKKMFSLNSIKLNVTDINMHD